MDKCWIQIIQWLIKDSNFELIEQYFHTPSITAKELNKKQKNNENCIVIDGQAF